jgi:hypothetical protein
VTFNVVGYLAFMDVVKATSMAGFAYIPSMYHAMQTKHIESKKLRRPQSSLLLYMEPPYVLTVGTMPLVGC